MKDRECISALVVQTSCMRLLRPWRSYSTIAIKSFANGIKVGSKNAASEIYLFIYLC